MIFSSFSSLSERDRKVLTFSLPVIILLIIWLGFIQPINTENDRLERLLIQKTTDLVWMQKNASSVVIAAPDKYSLPRLRQQTTQLINEQNLIISRIQSDNVNSISLWLQQASFTKILNVLHGAHELGIVISQLQINNSDYAGNVNIKLKVTTD